MSIFNKLHIKKRPVRITRWQRVASIGALCAGLFCSAAASAEPLVLASKNFTEQHILSAITVQYLATKGIEVTPKTDLASTIIRSAMLNKQVDMAWEYTGTSLIVYNQIKEPMTPEKTYQTVKELDGKKGIVWLEPAEMNNTYAFAMQKARAEKENIHTLSQLVERLNQIQNGDKKSLWMIGFDPEFVNRSDGLAPMQQKYGLKLERPQIRQMDSGLVYNAIRDGFVDVGLIYTTDGRVKGFNLQVLEDDKGFFPSYAVTPIVRTEVLERTPGLADALNTLSRLLNNDVISALNAKVDIEHQSSERVATQFLKDNGLL